VSPWAIASVNGLYWPYRLYIGQVLTIPAVPWVGMSPGPTCARQDGGTPPPATVTPGPTSTPATVTPVPTITPGACRAQYTVVAGDTLSSIARRYNVTVYMLAVRNNIYNINLIFAGQVLCIP
jgi:LysM repeat protein